MLIALAGCATRVGVPNAPLAKAPVAQAAWAGVLDRFVNPRGEVDFTALSQDRADLDGSFRFVADTPLPGDAANPADSNQRLAHLINAYNAKSMFNMIESAIPRRHAGLKKLTFFVNRKLRIGGEERSPYSFENDAVRPYTRRIGEPRVHFALNCSALACPALPRTPFTATDLPQQLAFESAAFFERSENFRVHYSARTVWLSEIRNSYTEDFLPDHGRNLIDYANRHVAAPAPIDCAVRFTPYDRTVANSQR